MLEIRSSSNSLIKDIKKLYRKKNRWEEEKYIIEGIKIVEEAIENNMDIENIVISERELNNKQIQNLLSKISNNNILVKVPDHIFLEISDTETPQGILAIVKFNKGKSKTKNKNPFYIYLDSLQDPGNLGTIIRSIDAFNLDGLLIGSGSVDPYNPKVVRASMGSIFRTNIIDIKNLSILKEFKEENQLSIMSTSLEGGLLEGENLDKGIICIIGNESRGISKEIEEISDILVKIPMPGKAESLNAGVAASIVMYEAMKIRL